MTHLADSPRDRVLAAAAEVFARSGYAGARVDEIALLAGVNKAMVYYHVGDKSLIYAIVVGERVERMLALLNDAIVAGTTPEEKLHSAVRAMTRAATANPHFAPMMLREIAAGGSGLPAKVVRTAEKVFQVFRGILDEGQRAGVFRRVDPVSTHMMIAGVVMLLSAGAPIRARLRSPSGSATGVIEDVAEGVFDLVIHGLRKANCDPSPTLTAPKKEGKR